MTAAWLAPVCLDELRKCSKVCKYKVFACSTNFFGGQFKILLTFFREGGVQVSPNTACCCRKCNKILLRNTHTLTHALTRTHTHTHKERGKQLYNKITQVKQRGKPWQSIDLLERIYVRVHVLISLISHYYYFKYVQNHSCTTKREDNIA